MGCKILNSDWTEWSTIQGVSSVQVISKSDECEVRGEFAANATNRRAENQLGLRILL